MSVGYSWSSLRVHMLAALFGSSSWLSVNSVFMEMPLMVPQLPEHWQLPSHLALIAQLAVVGPLSYGLLTRWWLKGTGFSPAPLIVVLLAAAIGLTALLAGFWDKTAVVFGETRSVCVLALFFGLALINCTSNVLFMPYMVAFKPAYLTAYFIGMGLSALVPSVVSLAQGTNRIDCVRHNSSEPATAVSLPARFNVSIFNLLMMLWLICCLVAFLLLNWSRSARQHRCSQQHGEGDEEGSPIQRRRQQKADEEGEGKVGEETPLNPGQAVTTEPVTSADEIAVTSTTVVVPAPPMGLLEYAFYLCATLFVCAFMNGVLPSIQSYNTLPYGVNTYHYALTIGNIANPLACFVPFLIEFDRLMAPVAVVTAVAALSAGYLVALALMSPLPLLVDSVWGSVICVAVSALASGSMAYVRTASAGALRTGAGDSASRLFWCGAFTQAGSFLGAVIIFPLVNIANVFTSAPYC